MKTGHAPCGSGTSSDATSTSTASVPGNRVAVNLGGIEHHDVRRGDALVRSGQWHRTTTVDASLTVLDSLDRPVSRRGAYLIYIGSGEHAVRMRVLGGRSIGAGATGSVRLHLPRPLPARPW